jgi:hypothetical protein
VPGNWFMPGFDDSSWFSGQAPFGNSFGGSMGNTTGPQTPNSPVFPSGVAWSTNLGPYVRTTFTLPSQMNLTLWLAVDNGIFGAYLNGVQATASVNAEGTANRWEHVFDIPAAYTYAGLNTLALQLEDHGGGTGFALIITADDNAQNPVFTTNSPPPPQSVPEPGAFGVLASGALALAGLRSRRRVSSQ